MKKNCLLCLLLSFGFVAYSQQHFLSDFSPGIKYVGLGTVPLDSLEGISSLGSFALSVKWLGFHRKTHHGIFYTGTTVQMVNGFILPKGWGVYVFGLKDLTRKFGCVTTGVEYYISVTKNFCVTGFADAGMSYNGQKDVFKQRQWYAEAGLAFDIYWPITKNTKKP